MAYSVKAPSGAIPPKLTAAPKAPSKVSHAPRIKPIMTRLYTKGMNIGTPGADPQAPNPASFGGAGFGTTGLTGET